MKGCLSFLVFVALLLGVFTWFLLPPLTGLAVETLIPRDAIGGTVRARVEVDFPPELYTLHADAVVLTGDRVSVAEGRLDVDTLAVTLEDVRLLGRTAARIQGRLAGVRVNQGPITLVSVKRIDLAGPVEAIVATLTIDGQETRLRAVAALDAVLSNPPEALTLQAPDRVSARVNGVTVSGRLVVRDGGLLVVGDAPLPTVELVPSSATGPLHLTSVRISGGDVVVKGRLDASALGIAAP